MKLALLACTATPPPPTFDDSHDTEATADSQTPQDTAYPWYTGWEGHECEDTPWKTVAASQPGACGIHVDGCVECWGFDPEYFPMHPPPGPMVDLALPGTSEWDGTEFHACAIDEQGDAHCWGLAGWGQAAVPPGLELAAIDVTDDATCGLRGSAVRCFGRPDFVANAPAEHPLAAMNLGPDAWGCAITFDGAIGCWDYGRTWLESGHPPGPWTMLDFSGGITALHADGAAYTWLQGYGEETVNGPYAPPRGETFIDVCDAVNGGCGLTDVGTLKCWGNWRWRQSAPLTTPLAVISCGNRYACGVDLDGELWCWGEGVQPGQTEHP